MLASNRRIGYTKRMPSLPVPSLVKESGAGDSGSDTRLLYLHSCRKVFIQRDYSNGLNVRFETAYPLQFRGMVSEDTWATTIDRINAIFAEAEKVGWPSIFETILGCATCYCSRLVSSTIYEKKIAELDQYLYQQNRDIYHPANLNLLTPMERGLRVMEISLLGTDESVRSEEEIQREAAARRARMVNMEPRP